MTNKASNKIQKSTSEFVSKLVKEFESGSVAIFCGAGISIPSGLPSSLDLVENILNKLHISDKTPDDILNAIPLERFFELLSSSIRLGFCRFKLMPQNCHSRMLLAGIQVERAT